MEIYFLGRYPAQLRIYTRLVIFILTNVVNTVVQSSCYMVENRIFLWNLSDLREGCLEWVYINLVELSG
jgi:hypothetical protein